MQRLVKQLAKECPHAHPVYSTVCFFGPSWGPLSVLGGVLAALVRVLAVLRGVPTVMKEHASVVTATMTLIIYDNNNQIVYLTSCL